MNLMGIGQIVWGRGGGGGVPGWWGGGWGGGEVSWPFQDLVVLVKSATSGGGIRFVETGLYLRLFVRVSREERRIPISSGSKVYYPLDLRQTVPKHWDPQDPVASLCVAFATEPSPSPRESRGW